MIAWRRKVSRYLGLARSAGRSAFRGFGVTTDKDRVGFIGSWGRRRLLRGRLLMMWNRGQFEATRICDNEDVSQ